MRRFIPILLILIFIISVPFFAAEDDDTVYYTVNNDSITIVGSFGREAEVTVPSMIAGTPVNTIAAGAFTENRYIEKLNLPDTISKDERGAIAERIKVTYKAYTDHSQDMPAYL